MPLVAASGVQLKEASGLTPRLVSPFTGGNYSDVTVMQDAWQLTRRRSQVTVKAWSSLFGQDNRSSRNKACANGRTVADDGTRATFRELKTLHTGIKPLLAWYLYDIRTRTWGHKNCKTDRFIVRINKSVTPLIVGILSKYTTALGLTS